MITLADFKRKLPRWTQPKNAAVTADLPDQSARPIARTVPSAHGAIARTPSPFRFKKRASPKTADVAAKTCAPDAITKATVDQANVSPPHAAREAASKALSIPCPDPTLEERTRDEHQNRALALVRQEDWAQLSALIRQADCALTMTPGGMSVAELLAFGARADVVLAAEHALLDSVPDQDAPLMRGIEALEYVLADNSGDFVIGCIVAQAHMDLAWSWRGIGWDVEVAPRNREAFDAHFARAREIIEPFEAQIKSSALLAATACALLRGSGSEDLNVADQYEALIDLDPKNSKSLRALGTHMLPRYGGSYKALELEARRTAARTQKTWGNGGYTWVMFDAISVDDNACAQLDLPFFIEGLKDIVQRRRDPHTVNLLAAYCANTMGEAFSGDDAADAHRSQIAACANWIVREHLTELHPMIWAHASQGFANNLRVASAQRFAAAGYDDALRIIAGLFRKEINDGKQIVFTPDGPVATAT